jgi:quinol monooxygenase YgiN
MKAGKIERYVCLVALIMLTIPHVAFAQKSEMLVRISEIEIHKDSLTSYNAILKEEAAASVRLEPGVISIFPMYQMQDSTQIRILEIYLNKDAYDSHIKSPHFKHYKSATLNMVKALKLVDMYAMDEKTMGQIFSKLKD